MNKRIRKKHQWLGVKRAGANYCANEIAQHIGRKILYSGITPKPSYVLNVRRHVRWFFHHSSEEQWLKRVAEAYDPSQMMLLSAKHLLPVDYTAFNGRYGPNPPLKDMLEDLVRKAKKEKLLSGVNVHIDDMHSLEHFIRTYKEYGATDESLSQEEEIDGPEKSLAQRVQEEYDKRRKKLIDKIKNDDTEFNNIGEDGGPTMDYRIQSYDDYGAHGPIEPIVLVEGESKPGWHNEKHRDFPLKAKRSLVGFDENGNTIWKDIKRDKEEE